MKTEYTISSKVIKNSPVEFVLVAPVKGHDRIIISSDNAGLDIKGLAVERDTDVDSLRSLNSGLSLMFGLGRQFNVLDSYSTEDLYSDYDSRKSSFRFAWVGYCSPQRKEKIEKTFNRSLKEIKKAIIDDSEADIELAFSPVILGCSIAHQARLRSRRFMLFVISTYALAGVTAAIASFIAEILKR